MNFSLYGGSSAVNVFEYYSGQLGAYTNVQYDTRFGSFCSFLLMTLCHSDLVLGFWRFKKCFAYSI